MKVTVMAKIKNSPVIPEKEFTAQKVFTFDKKENTFGRALAVREYFKKKYGQEIDLEIVSAIWH